MRSFILTIAIALCAIIPARTQWVMMKSDGDTILQRGIDHIYNVEFDAAHTAFTTVIGMYPSHPAGYFLDAMVEWWRIELDRKNTAYDQRFLEKIDRVIAVCERMLDSTPRNITALFFKGGAIGFRGRFHVTRGNYFSAADDGRQALSILQECQKIAPGNHDIMLGTGLYNYYSVAIPEKMPGIGTLMMFLPSGDKLIGLAQLKACARQAKYAANEAKVVLIQAYTEFEKNMLEAMTFARDLHNRYPKNPKFQRDYGRCLIALGPLDSAEIEWRDVLLKYMDKSFGYDKLAAREALYYIAVCRLQNRDLENALRYFYKCDEASRSLDQDPSGYMVKTNLHVGKIYDLQGKRDLAIKQYRKVLSWDDVGGSRAEAERYLATPYR
jgi:hypothetical protein